MSKGFHRLPTSQPWSNRAIPVLATAASYPLPAHKGAIAPEPDKALAVMEAAAMGAEPPVGPTDLGPPKMSREQATSAGFTGNSCNECGSLQMVRNGTCEKCNSCGATTGCS